MTPADIRTALAGILTSATSIPAASIYWANRPRRWAEPQYAVCRLRSIANQGRDKVIYEHDGTRPLGTEIEPHAKGLRELVWSVQIHSHDATNTADSLILCNALRDRLELPETTDTLAVADLAFASVAMLTDLSVTQDGRELSVAQIDIKLNASSDVAGTRFGYVETWGITGRATMPDGSTPIIVDGVYP